MSNLATVTTALYNVLDSSAATAYPIIATESADYPFIVYERQSVTPILVKDGIAQYDYTFAVKVVAADYLSSLKLADATANSVRNITSDNVQFDNVTVTTSSEEYTNDAYVQTLYVSFRATTTD